MPGCVVINDCITLKTECRGSRCFILDLCSRQNLYSGFPTRSDTNRAVQPQKMTRDLKSRVKKEEGLYCLCSETKGADQLRGFRIADLRLCFRICKKRITHDEALMGKVSFYRNF